MLAVRLVDRDPRDGRKELTPSCCSLTPIYASRKTQTHRQTHAPPLPAPRFEINEKKNKNERNTLMVWQKVLRTVLVRYADISCIRLQQSRLPSGFQHRRASGYCFPPVELVFAIESKISSLNAVCSSFCLYSFLNVLWSRFIFDTMVHCVNPQNDRSEWPWYGKTSKCACVCIAMGAVPAKSVSLYQLSCARRQTENSDILTVNLLEDLGPEEDETPQGLVRGSMSP